jgi:hypothetical protein
MLRMAYEPRFTISLALLTCVEAIASLRERICFAMPQPSHLMPRPASTGIRAAVHLT